MSSSMPILARSLASRTSSFNIGRRKMSPLSSITGKSFWNAKFNDDTVVTPTKADIFPVIRTFSSESQGGKDDGNNDAGGGGRGGRGGYGGRGGGRGGRGRGGGGRGPGRYQRMNDGEVGGKGGSKNKPKKQNFAKTFLDPAFRGELTKNHESGIPRLAARKSKGHAVKDDFPGREIDLSLRENDMFGQDIDDLQDFNKRSETLKSVVGRLSGQGNQKQQERQQKQNLMKKKREEKESQAKLKELSKLFAPPTPEELDPSLKPLIPIGRPRPPEYFQNLRSMKNNKDRRKLDPNRPQFNMYGLKMTPQEIEEYNNTPLDDFPTEDVGFELESLHPESRREPKPIVHPTNRFNPPDEFVESHESFLFVNYLPHPIVSDKENDEAVLGKFDNPLHKHALAEYVANMLNVDVTTVSPATMTSAFVGFKSAADAAKVYQSADSSLRSKLPPAIDIQPYKNEEGDENLKEFLEGGAKDASILEVKNVPAGIKPGRLSGFVQEFFDRLNQDGSSNSIDTLTRDSVYEKTPTTSLLRITYETNKPIISKLQKHLTQKLQRYQRPQFHAAHRELIHGGYSGPARFFFKKKLGKSLVVSGDVPTKDFFLSHAMVLHLHNVPNLLRKNEISTIFQPYCFERRDVEGSIELVRSLDGSYTGRAYVGFDLEEEGMKALKCLGPTFRFNEKDAAPTYLRPVKEKMLRRGSKLKPRSNRTAEELLEALEDTWKDYVSEEDLQYLEANGVSRQILEEAFITARYHNPTFGVEDEARRGERLRKDKAPGQQYEEFVKLYVETLKEVVEDAGTVDNPGIMYRGMFMPGEEIDKDYLKKEEERVKNLREKYKWW